MEGETHQIRAALGKLRAEVKEILRASDKSMMALFTKLLGQIDELSGNAVKMWQMRQNQSVLQPSVAHTAAPPVLLNQSMVHGAAPPELNRSTQSQLQLNDSTGQPWREDDEILPVDEDFAMLPENQVELNMRENIKVTQF